MFLVERAGVQLHCTSMGGGPVLVLCHGLVFGSMASWYFSIAAKLAQSYRVILYDQRGHGKSTLAANGYDVATMADDLGAIIEQQVAVGESITLIGHSYGALIALHYALRNRGQGDNAGGNKYPLRSLVLIDAPLPAAHYVFPSLATLTSSAALLAQLPEFLRTQLASGERRAARVIARLEFLLLQSSLRADVAAAGDIHNSDLQTLDLPVLCIYGRHSDCAAVGERLVAQLPRAQLQWLDCGHYIVQEAPAALLNALTQFAELGEHCDGCEYGYQ